MVHRSTGVTRGRALLPLLLLSLTLLQCGIPSYPYLFPPKYKKISQAAETTFEFFNDTRTNILYLEGYEIYYKFYSDDPADTDYETDKTIIESLGDGQENLTVSTLENQKFHRMYQNYTNPNNLPKPLLSIGPDDKNTEFLVTIDFSFLDEISKPFPIASFLSTSIEIGRYVTVNNSIEYYLESFIPANFQYAYSDLDTSLSSESFLNIALVVFTYGVDESLSQLYSLPLHLGKIRLSTHF